MSLELFCPDCHGALFVTPNVLRCKNCLKDWPLDGDIPILTDQFAWYPKEHMDELQFEEFLRDIEHSGWEKALQKAMAGMRKPKTFWALAFDENRRDLANFLPINKTMTILDYGCGVGGITFNLAKACKHLYAIDQSLLRVKFIQARSKYTGVANVTAICAGSSRYLPYDDSVFDAVVMNGVLEWMPITQKGRPYQIQFQALKEINRVLKKGGFIYLGIENRFGYRYLWQAKGDNHNQKKRKIPYITAMPRFLAQIYSYLTVGGAYRCHLYSYSGYRRMFNKAKFGRCDFYFPYPNHNQLHYVVALGKKKEAALAIEHMVNHSAFPAKEKRALLFLGKTGLLRYLAQDYTIIATK